MFERLKKFLRGDDYYSDAFCRAAEKGDIAAVKELLKEDSVQKNITINDNYALRKAVENGHTEVVKRLLKEDKIRSSAHADKNYALRLAASYGYLDIVEKLLKVDSVMRHVGDDYNRILCIAAENGHDDIVQKLLTIKKVESNANADNNSALRLAASNGKIDVVKILLEIPRVEGAAHAKHNDALIEAARNGHFEVVERLLEINAVRDRANINRNIALCEAAKGGHLRIVKELLKINVVKNDVYTNARKVFNHAISAGNFDIANELLGMDVVKRYAHFDKNKALRLAIENGHIDLAKKLLIMKDVKENTNILFLVDAVKYSQIEIARKLLEIDKVYHAATAEHELLAKAMIESMKKDKRTGIMFVNEILLLLGHPIIPSDTKRVSAELIKKHLEKELKPFSSLKEEAARILALRRKYFKLIKDDDLDFASLVDDESSMNNALMKKVNKHFEEVIEKKYKDKFESYGGRDTNERLAKIEEEIRGFILDKILASLGEDKSDKSNKIRKLINDKRVDLIKGIEPTMNEARKLFISNSVNAEIAWRCYDNKASNVGWTNLFVAPESEKAANTVIYTTRESRESAEGKRLTLKEGTEIVRKRAAYYFFAANDSNDDVKDDFINMLAEVKRAHNESTTTTDNPSCFPGTLTRLAEIVRKDNTYTMAKNKKMIIDEFMVHTIDKKLDQYLADCVKVDKSEDDNDTAVFQCCDAITVLNESSASSFLSGEGDLGGIDIYSVDDYTSSYFDLRKDFVIQINPSGFIRQVEEKLRSENMQGDEAVIKPVERAYIEYLLSTLSTSIENAGIIANRHTGNRHASQVQSTAVFRKQDLPEIRSNYPNPNMPGMDERIERLFKRELYKHLAFEKLKSKAGINMESLEGLCMELSVEDEIEVKLFNVGTETNEILILLGDFDKSELLEVHKQIKDEVNKEYIKQKSLLKNEGAMIFSSVSSSLSSSSGEIGPDELDNGGSKGKGFGRNQRS